MFIQQDFKILKIPLLKQLCKLKKIKYNLLKKSELIHKYNELDACKKIQRIFRTYFYKNAVDAITMENVSFPCFIYRVKNGKCFFYDYNSIIKYIMKTGKVIDPNTRIEYTDEELIKLDIQAKQHFPEKNFKSTLKIKKNKNYAIRIKNRENDILTYQMRLDEIKLIIKTMIEDDIFAWNILNEPIIVENIEYRNFNSYINSIIHEMKILFQYLKVYDQFEASCFKQSMESLENVPENIKSIIQNL